MPTCELKLAEERCRTERMTGRTIVGRLTVAYIIVVFAKEGKAATTTKLLINILPVKWMIVIKGLGIIDRDWITYLNQLYFVNSLSVCDRDLSQRNPAIYIIIDLTVLIPHQ
jgi:hypothetical protein